jgi:hypothetical protein
MPLPIDAPPLATHKGRSMIIIKRAYRCSDAWVLPPLEHAEGGSMHAVTYQVTRYLLSYHAGSRWLESLLLPSGQQPSQ